MKNGIVFCNPHLSSEAEKLEIAGKNRFKSLDAFNADLKSLTKLLSRFAVPNIDWVFDPENDLFQVGWHDETVVYREHKDNLALKDASPLYEATAFERWEIAKRNLLVRLLREATCIVKDKQAKEIVADVLSR